MRRAARGPFAVGLFLVGLLGCAPALKEVKAPEAQPAAPAAAAPEVPEKPAVEAPRAAQAPEPPPVRGTEGNLKDAEQKLEAAVRSLTAPVGGPQGPQLRETAWRLARWTSPDADPRILEARALETLGRRAEALALWEFLVVEGVRGRELLASFASLAVGLGRSEQAVRVLAARLGRSPGDPDANGILGWVYLSRGEVAKAVGPLGATWSTPAAPRYALFLGRARLLAGDAAGALAPARLAAGEPSVEVEGLVLVGDVCRAGGESAAAEEAYRKALERSPAHYAASVNLGVSKLEGGKAADAEALFSSASQVRPDLPEGWNGLGLVRRNKGDYDGAAKAFGKALEVSPRFAPALKNLGILHEKYLGRPAEALPLYDRYLAVRPGDAEVERWKKAASRLAEGAKK